MRENEKETGTRDRNEDLVSHCPRRAHGRQRAGCLEPGLQERPTCVVRSEIHGTAPHKNWGPAIKAAIIDFDQIAGGAEWARVVLSGCSE